MKTPASANKPRVTRVGNTRLRWLGRKPPIIPFAFCKIGKQGIIGLVIRMNMMLIIAMIMMLIVRMVIVLIVRMIMNHDCIVATFSLPQA